MVFCTTTNRRDLKSGSSGKGACDGSDALEVLHTSCSVPIVVGSPAPRDDPKGDASPYFFVESFIETEGRTVFNPAVQSIDSACSVPDFPQAPTDDPDPIDTGSGTGKSSSSGTKGKSSASGSDLRRLRNRRRAGVIVTDRHEMVEGRSRHSSISSMSSGKGKGYNNEMIPAPDILMNYQCQYKVTNTGSSAVTVTVVSDGTAIDIDLITLGPTEESTFTLDYDHKAGNCPNVTVSASTEGGCDSEATWSPPPSTDGRRRIRKMIRSGRPTTTAQINNKKKDIFTANNSWDV